VAIAARADPAEGMSCCATWKMQLLTVTPPEIVP
jgi:hypothetical protein